VIKKVIKSFIQPAPAQIYSFKFTVESQARKKACMVKVGLGEKMAGKWDLEKKWAGKWDLDPKSKL
jgi:hypothetical protein